MKVCSTHRVNLYQVLRAVFDAMDKRPVVAEVGVLRGEMP